MIYSENLILRPYTKDDFLLIIDLFQNWQFENVDEVFAKNYFEKKLLPDYEKGGGVLAIFLKENENYIGHCGVRWNEQEQEWQLTFRFLKDFWKKQLPSEAIFTSINWAFKKLTITEIAVLLEEKNRGAAKVLEKIGFKLRFETEEDNMIFYRYSIFS